MGTGSVSGVVFYTEGGIPLPSAIDLPEITEPEDAAGPVCPAWPDTEMTLTLKLKTPKHWRCKSRKRFIKLMMGEGIRHNDAVWLADFVRGFMTHSEAWHNYLLTGRRYAL